MLTCPRMDSDGTAKAVQKDGMWPSAVSAFSCTVIGLYDFEGLNDGADHHARGELMKRRVQLNVMSLLAFQLIICFGIVARDLPIERLHQFPFKARTFTAKSLVREIQIMPTLRQVLRNHASKLDRVARSERTNWLIRFLWPYAYCFLRLFFRIVLFLRGERALSTNPQNLPKFLPLQRGRRLSISSSAESQDSEPQIAFQQQSRLLTKLPLEIRQQIYSHAVAYRVIHITLLQSRLGHVTCCEPFGGPVPHDCWHRPPHSPQWDHDQRHKSHCDDRDGLSNLLKTCRQIYCEAIDIFYASNTFIIHRFRTLYLLAGTVLPHRLRCIRSFHMVWSSDSRRPTQNSERRRQREWERAWSILSSLTELRYLQVELGYGFSYSPSRRSAEETMFTPAWKVRLAQKWQLCTPWGDTGADFTAAPFNVVRDYKTGKRFLSSN